MSKKNSKILKPNKKNRVKDDDFGCKLDIDGGDIDGGPIWTTPYGKLNAKQKQQIKATLAELSEAEKGYNVFINDYDGKDQLKGRSTFRINNKNRGARTIIANDKKVVLEADK